MSIKLIQFQVTLNVETKQEINLEKYSLVWKLDCEKILFSLANATNFTPLELQSNFIMNQNRIYEDKITTILLKNSNDEIVKEFTFNLSNFLNKNQKEIYDSILVNEKDKIILKFELYKIMALDLGQSNSSSKTCLELFQFTSESQNEEKLNQNHSVHKKEENNIINLNNHFLNSNSQLIVNQLAKENKKLKTLILELNRQIQELKSLKPIYIQPEIEGFLREYQLENEKLRNQLKIVISDNLVLRTTLEKLNQRQFQNIFNLQNIIQKLQEKSQDSLIGCTYFDENIKKIKLQSEQYQSSLDQFDQIEQERKQELKKLLSGTKIYSPFEVTNLGEDSNKLEHRKNVQQSSEQLKEHIDFQMMLDND